MATYFHGAPEIQSDGLQTLYLMNPGYVGYPDAPGAAPGNMVFLNSSTNSLNSMNLPHNPQLNQQQQHFVGIQLQPTMQSQDSGHPSSIHSSHDMSAVHGLVSRLQYNLWNPTPTNNSNSIDMSSQLGLRRPSGTAPPPQQGLSLSLSPQQPQYAQYRPEPEISAPVQEISPVNAEEVRISGSSSSASAVSNGISGLQSVLMGSKYLKSAQQLLDEVVNVGKGIKGEPMKGASSKSQMKTIREMEGGGGGEISAKQGAELTTAERQELQMKKAKLVNMLDEVEHRYRQYHHQMQIVVSSFEAAAGLGSARTYTALALQTISKQFRCLRDAISSQIRATSKSLGEEDCLAAGTKSEGSRLRFVDHHLRQQRALQQLGMIQHNAWRPQRGLPERSVSVLRAWLFEHFLHPYPKDSDKHMLAKQTGLTRSQVSNWFINARVRLWKPMVEEMYLEETKEQEQNNGDEKTSKSDGNEDSASKSSACQENSLTRTEQTDSFKTNQQESLNELKPPTTIPSSGNFRNHSSYQENETIMQSKLKKARSDESLQQNTLPYSMNIDMGSDETNNREILMKFGDGRRSSGDHEYSLITGVTNHGGAYGAYPIGDIGRFGPEQFTPRYSGNGVSLTLGLPHCENLSVSGTQPSYLSSESIPLGRRLDMSTDTNDYCSLNNNPSVAHSANSYENINIQNRKRFASQLLPDFVA